MKYRFEAAAKDELYVSAEFYEKKQPGVGLEFHAAVDHALRRIASDPESHPESVAGTRCITLKQFPFQLIYVVEGDGFVIYAVAHQSRRPGYWIHRLSDSGHEG